MSPIVSTLAAQDYTQLIQTGGPVLAAFIVFFAAIYIVGKRVVIPALNIYREITLNNAHLIDGLKEERKRFAAAADRIEDYFPPEKRKKEKSIYES